VTEQFLPAQVSHDPAGGGADVEHVRRQAGLVDTASTPALPTTPTQIVGSAAPRWFKNTASA
jgi:hypothetical protein